jgi:cell division protein FtsW (lipid II flippase)
MENQDSQNTISWEANEFKEYTKNTGWYAGVVLITVILVGLAVWQKDVFGAISLIVIAGIVLFLLNRRPGRILISLTPKGIFFGESFISYKNIRHFWIVEADHHRTVNLETTAYLNRVQMLELEDQDMEAVRFYLSQYIPEHEGKQETLAQQFMHRFHL